MAVDVKKLVEILDMGDWVSMEVFTANINKGTGGKLLVLSKCRIARSRAGKRIGTVAERKIGVKKRDSNANENFTRNIELPDKRIITIHPIVVYKINNQLVI